MRAGQPQPSMQHPVRLYGVPCGGDDGRAAPAEDGRDCCERLCRQNHTSTQTSPGAHYSLTGMGCVAGAAAGLRGCAANRSKQTFLVAKIVPCGASNCFCSVAKPHNKN